MENLRKNVLRSGIPDNVIAYPDPQNYAVGPSDNAVANIYRASDVMLLPSRGEGFGLPVLEAQACGCPVVINDCSSISELCVNGVKKKPIQPQWIQQLSYYWQIPSITGIADGLHEVFNWSETERKENAEKGIEFAQGYDWPVVFDEYWKPFLAHVEEKLW